MNQKERASKIKALTEHGDIFISSQYGIRSVTRMSEFNCYLNEVRHTWNTIEWCVRNGTLKFQDEIKQSKAIDLYRGSKSKKVPA